MGYPSIALLQPSPSYRQSYPKSGVAQLHADVLEMVWFVVKRRQASSLLDSHLAVRRHCGFPVSSSQLSIGVHNEGSLSPGMSAQ